MGYQTIGLTDAVPAFRGGERGPRLGPRAIRRPRSYAGKNGNGLLRNNMNLLIDALPSYKEVKPKISKISATKCHTVSTKCTKFDFRGGSAPDPRWGAYSAPPNHVAAFKGPTSNGRGSKKEGKERKGKGWKEGKGKGGNGRRGPRKTYGRP